MAATVPTAMQPRAGSKLPRDALISAVASQPSGSSTQHLQDLAWLSSSISGPPAAGSHAPSKPPGNSLTMADAAAAGSLVVGPTGLPSIHERMQRWLQQDDLGPPTRRHSRVGSTASLDGTASTAATRQASSAASGAGAAVPVRTNGTGDAGDQAMTGCWPFRWLGILKLGARKPSGQPQVRHQSAAPAQRSGLAQRQQQPHDHHHRQQQPQQPTVAAPPQLPQPGISPFRQYTGEAPEPRQSTTASETTHAQDGMRYSRRSSRPSTRLSRLGSEALAGMQTSQGCADSQASQALSQPSLQMSQQPSQQPQQLSQQPSHALLQPSQLLSQQSSRPLSHPSQQLSQQLSQQPSHLLSQPSQLLSQQSSRPLSQPSQQLSLLSQQSSHPLSQASPLLSHREQQHGVILNSGDMSGTAAPCSVATSGSSGGGGTGRGTGVKEVRLVPAQWPVLGVETRGSSSSSRTLGSPLPCSEMIRAAVQAQAQERRCAAAAAQQRNLVTPPGGPGPRASFSGGGSGSSATSGGPTRRPASASRSFGANSNCGGATNTAATATVYARRSVDCALLQQAAGLSDNASAPPSQGDEGLGGTTVGSAYGLASRGSRLVRSSLGHELDDMAAASSQPRSYFALHGHPASQGHAEMQGLQELDEAQELQGAFSPVASRCSHGELLGACLVADRGSGCNNRQASAAAQAAMGASSGGTMPFTLGPFAPQASDASGSSPAGDSSVPQASALGNSSHHNRQQQHSHSHPGGVQEQQHSLGLAQASVPGSVVSGAGSGSEPLYLAYSGEEGQQLHSARVSIAALLASRASQYAEAARAEEDTHAQYDEQAQVQRVRQACHALELRYIADALDTKLAAFHNTRLSRSLRDSCAGGSGHHSGPGASLRSRQMSCTGDGVGGGRGAASGPRSGSGSHARHPAGAQAAMGGMGLGMRARHASIAGVFAPEHLGAAGFGAAVRGFDSVVGGVGPAGWSSDGSRGASGIHVSAMRPAALAAAAGSAMAGPGSWSSDGRRGMPGVPLATRGPAALAAAAGSATAGPGSWSSDGRRGMPGIPLVAKASAALAPTAGPSMPGPESWSSAGHRGAPHTSPASGRASAGMVAQVTLAERAPAAIAAPATSVERASAGTGMPGGSATEPTSCRSSDGRSSARRGTSRMLLLLPTPFASTVLPPIPPSGPLSTDPGSSADAEQA